jgi:hypothetical protein
MHNKNSEITNLYHALIKRFGPDAFVPTKSDKLGANHVVFTSSRDNRIELSVVAYEDELRRGHYSIEVEVGMKQPDFDIPIVKENLSIEDVLNIFAAYQRHA